MSRCSSHDVGKVQIRREFVTSLLAPKPGTLVSEQDVTGFGEWQFLLTHVGWGGRGHEEDQIDVGDSQVGTSYKISARSCALLRLGI